MGTIESIRRWWRHLGTERYPEARRLLITADCGGSNGHRARLWKVELRSSYANSASRSACATCCPARAVDKIERRLFSFIFHVDMLTFDLVWRGFPGFIGLICDNSSHLALIWLARFGVCLPCQDFISIVDTTVAAKPHTEDRELCASSAGFHQRTTRISSKTVVGADVLAHFRLSHRTCRIRRNRKPERQQPSCHLEPPVKLSRGTLVS